MCCCFICCLTERPLQRNTRRPDLKMSNQGTSFSTTVAETVQVISCTIPRPGHDAIPIPNLDDSLWEGSDTRWHFGHLEVDRSDKLNKDFLKVRSNEKIALEELNNRFAAFIEKVQSLEQRNSSLNMQLINIKHKGASTSQVSQIYEKELTDLHAKIASIRSMYDRFIIDNKILNEDLVNKKKSLQEVTEKRTSIEHKLVTARKERNEKRIQCKLMESRIEKLRSLINFLMKAHDEAISDVEMNFKSLGVSTEAGITAKTDLSSALKEIRAQYEIIAFKINQETKQWHMSQFNNLVKVIKNKSMALRETRNNIITFNKKIKDLEFEAQSFRSKIENLESSKKNLKDKIQENADGHLQKVYKLEEEIRTLKAQMCQHMTQYQDLLNVKTALDAEITIYRKLLDGEETRISGSLVNMSTLSIQSETTSIIEHTKNTLVAST